MRTGFLMLSGLVVIALAACGTDKGADALGTFEDASASYFPPQGAQKQNPTLDSGAGSDDASADAGADASADSGADAGRCRRDRCYNH